MRVRKMNNDVFVADGPIVKVERQDVQILASKLSSSSRNRVRLCAHKSNGDLLHEMLIVLANDSYIRPHRHLRKSESFHIIEGLVDIVIFDKNGGISDVIPMGDYTSGRKFFYRLAQPDFHTLIVRSKVVIFHETTNGPFEPSETEFAPWAPDETNAQAASAFMSALSSAAEGLISRQTEETRWDIEPL
jgi:cupin fold WbuC family metalloprotein